MPVDLQCFPWLAGDQVAETDDDATETAGKKPGLWRRWVVGPIVQQLKQGTSPDKLGWTIGTGVAVGIFPLFGIRGWACLLAGMIFKLNQPLLHTFKGLMYPLHLALIIPFIQMGQWIYRQPALNISLDALKKEVERGLMPFWQEFGWVVLRAGTAWLIVAPVLLLAVKWAVTPVLRRLVKSIKRA